jgi:hypothetical protein
MVDAAIVDEDDLDDGYMKGHMAAVRSNRDINTFIRESDASSDWKCSFVLGYLDTMVGLREAISLELDEYTTEEDDVYPVSP